jgi:hypothetical protein
MFESANLSFTKEEATVFKHHLKSKTRGFYQQKHKAALPPPFLIFVNEC